MTKVKWIKVWTDMFDDEKMKLIDTLPERDTINYIWMRLLVQAGKTNSNGEIYLTENIPHTEEMLSTIFNRPIDSIKLALKTLRDLEMIEIGDCNVLKIKNWETNQNVEGMERLREATRKRVAEYRKRKRAKKEERVKKEQANKEERKYEKTCDMKVIAEKMDDQIKEIERVNNEEVIEDIDNEGQFKINQAGVKMLTHYEKILGRIGVFNLREINISIEQYGEEHVRRAIDRAIEVDKISMKYVNGILKNWVREGFPERW